MALIGPRGLLAIQTGGRGQHHVERAKVEGYILRCYDETERRLHGEQRPAMQVEMSASSRDKHSEIVTELRRQGHVVRLPPRRYAFPFPIAVTDLSDELGHALEQTILGIDPQAVHVEPQSSFVS